jgi:hypothetical protein
VAHVDEIPLHPSHTQATAAEPTDVELARSLDRPALFVLDLLQNCEDVRVGSEAGQYLN